MDAVKYKSMSLLVIRVNISAICHHHHHHHLFALLKKEIIQFISQGNGEETSTNQNVRRLYIGGVFFRLFLLFSNSKKCVFNLTR